MANLESQLVDDIIVNSRRKMLTLGGTALAGMLLGTAATKSADAQTTYSDADILNFALNLEYLEANFYYLAAFGCTIDKPNAAAIAAGAPSAGIPVNKGVGTAGTVSGGSKVNFSTITAASYAAETAIEEGKHVLFLQTAIGSSTMVAQPALNLGTSWQMLVAAANMNYPAGAIPPTFSPYADDNSFLIGAYVFEDVGVTAYHGAASLLKTSGNLSAAGGILAVEAYHAGLIRTTLFAIDTAPGSLTAGALKNYTTSISNLRSALAQAAQPQTLGSGSSKVGTIDYDVQPDDFGLATFNVTLASMGATAAARLTNSDTTDATNPLPLAIAPARTPTQVLNIVTGGGAVSGGKVVSPAQGVFFPTGLNGFFK